MDAGGWISGWGLDLGLGPGHLGHELAHREQHLLGRTIPAKLAAGNYVIRHEIIALHAASSTDGAQAYPQCVNFKITGGGSETITSGVLTKTFYTPSDPGILSNLYTTFTSYTIPGPAVTALKRGEAVREYVRDWFKAVW